MSNDLGVIRIHKDILKTLRDMKYDSELKSIEAVIVMLLKFKKEHKHE